MQNQARWPLSRECTADEVSSESGEAVSFVGTPVKVNGVASLGEAMPNDISFCAYEGERGIKAIGRSSAGIILCKKSLYGVVTPKKNQQLIFSENPRLAFVRFVNRRTLDKAPPARVSATAVIDPTARLGRDCVVGEHAVIGRGCVLGDRVVVDARCTLQNCSVGDGSSIQSGTVIGSDGFAYERYSDGSLERFPHFGRVIIGRNVEICANCSVARGSLQDTVIGDNAKLDALVHIAHNVQIGEYCQLAAGTIIGGSTTLGRSCWTGLNSTLKNHVTLGDNVLVAAGACVIADVPDGDVVAGVPAKSIKAKVKTDEMFIMTGKTLPT